MKHCLSGSLKIIKGDNFTMGAARVTVPVHFFLVNPLLSYNLDKPRRQHIVISYIINVKYWKHSLDSTALTVEYICITMSQPFTDNWAVKFFQYVFLIL